MPTNVNRFSLEHKREQIIAAENAVREAEQRRREMVFRASQPPDPNTAAIMQTFGGQMLSGPSGLPNPSGVLAHDPTFIPPQPQLPINPTGIPAHAPSPVPPVDLSVLLTRHDPSLGGAPNAPSAIARPAPLPEFTSVNAGMTPELMRLQELAEHVAAFTAMQPPTERPLPPMAAIAAGILGALDPAAAERLAPEVERFRMAPIEQYERERAARAADIEMEAQVTGAMSEAEDRQRSLLDIQSVINDHFERAQEVIDGTSTIAQQAAAMDDPVEKQFASELMRRTLMYRELISSAQQADSGTLGPQFVRSVENELNGITELINKQQEYRQGASIEGIQQAGAIKRAGASAFARQQSQLYKQWAPSYFSLKQLDGVLPRLAELATEVGAIEGLNPYSDDAQEFERLSSLIKNEVLFGEAGKALTAIERIELAGKVPSVYDVWRSKVSRVKGAQMEFRIKLNKIRATLLGAGLDIDSLGVNVPSPFDEGEGVELEPGEVSVGRIAIGEGY